jgi:hypothetical protein
LKNLKRSAQVEIDEAEMLDESSEDPEIVTIEAWQRCHIFRLRAPGHGDR